MLGSMMEDVGEQVRGKDIPPARGRGKRNKFIDIVANMEAKLLKVEIAMANTQEVVDLLEQDIEKDLGDLKEEIRDLHEGILYSQLPLVSRDKFMAFQDKVIGMLTSMNARLEDLSTSMEACDQEVQTELAIYKFTVSAKVMASPEAPKVEVAKP